MYSESVLGFWYIFICILQIFYVYMLALKVFLWILRDFCIKLYNDSTSRQCEMQGHTWFRWFLRAKH